jgi:hypothetical protein
MQEQGKAREVAIDRTTQVVGLMNHFWLVLFSEDNLRETAGLRYISHVGADQPYWYLWHTQCAGVYELELCGAQAVKDYDWVAEFAIKYYPDKDEPWYEGLSFVEKICRESEVFQTPPSAGGGCACHGVSHNLKEHRFADLALSTGAPSYVYRDVIPADFFYTGHLYIAFKDTVGSIIRLKTQTSWQVAVTKNHTIRNGDGQPLTSFRKGAVDRNYPGFAISNFIYQGIVKGWSSFHRYKISRGQIWRGEGATFLNDGREIRMEPSRHIERVIAQTQLAYRPEEVLAFVPDGDMKGMHLDN